MAVGNFDLQTLQCWRCEPKECHRHFDFTQHRMESCDGKCWKSFEVIETKTKEDREKAEETPALRQCFSSEDLTKASTIGLNTANGCRDVKMREKIKKFCFCDSNMCNGTKKLYSSVKTMHRTHNLEWKPLPYSMVLNDKIFTCVKD
ncbi:unnamed protein product [Didymodactylos carnosus]|uniref:Uncharacterized protein n=1 Tax=Didymodactylos carnosus TaxID=1234261 RepID=A0A8S2I307_9BILA|nr:unnamed protein product [Didymodactylos carnosus]CAF3707959.1 unnamed protein product [Didymodactylos carnosus]